MHEVVFHVFLKPKTVANSRQKARTSRKWAPNQHFGAIVFFDAFLGSKKIDFGGRWGPVQ